MGFVHAHFWKKSDFFIFFTVLFKKLIIKIWKWRFDTKKLDYVYISLVKKISSNLIGIPVLQPCEHNRFCRFFLFFVRRSVYGRRVFSHFGGFFYCVFKHTSDINMKNPFISQVSSFIIDDDKKKYIEIPTTNYKNICISVCRVCRPRRSPSCVRVLTHTS